MITSEPRVGPILKLLAAFTSAETGAGWDLVMEGSNTHLCLQEWAMEHKLKVLKIFVKDRP